MQQPFDLGDATELECGLDHRTGLLDRHDFISDEAAQHRGSRTRAGAVAVPEHSSQEVTGNVLGGEHRGVEHHPRDPVGVADPEGLSQVGAVGRAVHDCARHAAVVEDRGQISHHLLDREGLVGQVHAVPILPGESDAVMLHHDHREVPSGRHKQICCSTSYSPAPGRGDRHGLGANVPEFGSGCAREDCRACAHTCPPHLVDQGEQAAIRAIR